MSAFSSAIPTASYVPGPGFGDPVFGAQAAFRAVMWALARPGRPEPLPVDLVPPPPLSAEAAAVVLALCDHETPLWLDPALAAAPEVAAFLRFHTGAPLVAEPAAARFAVISSPLDMLAFSSFAAGSPDYPDASATLVLQLAGFTPDAPAARALRLEGPGVEGALDFAAGPLPADIAVRLAANRALFPRGVDLILTAPGAVAGLPRSVVAREG